MTIKAYLDALDNCGAVDVNGKSISCKAAEVTHIWSNQACLGYFYLTIKGALIDEQEKARLVSKMQSLFETIGIDEAAKERFVPKTTWTIELK